MPSSSTLTSFVAIGALAALAAAAVVADAQAIRGAQAVLSAAEPPRFADAGVVPHNQFLAIPGPAQKDVTPSIAAAAATLRPITGVQMYGAASRDASEPPFLVFEKAPKVYKVAVQTTEVSKPTKATVGWIKAEEITQRDLAKYQLSKPMVKPFRPFNQFGEGHVYNGKFNPVSFVAEMLAPGRAPPPFSKALEAYAAKDPVFAADRNFQQEVAASLKKLS